MTQDSVHGEYTRTIQEGDTPTPEEFGANYHKGRTILYRGEWSKLIRAFCHEINVKLPEPDPLAYCDAKSREVLTKKSTTDDTNLLP